MKFNKSLKCVEEEILSEEALRRFFYQAGEYDYLFGQIAEVGKIEMEKV